jgi:anti-anti-sigma regulatory factor
MPEVPVIMFSAHSDSSTEKEARSAGVSALVSKFEHTSVLLGKARSALEPEELRPFKPLSAGVIGRERLCSLHSRQTGGYEMMHDFQLARGDICGDPTGLRVSVEDIDIHGYVHFSVIGRSHSGNDDPESGQMSHAAFVHRFTKLGNMLANRKAA